MRTATKQERQTTEPNGLIDIDTEIRYSRCWNEYTVRILLGGKHLEGQDRYTDNSKEAEEMAAERLAWAEMKYNNREV